MSGVPKFYRCDGDELPTLGSYAEGGFLTALQHKLAVGGLLKMGSGVGKRITPQSAKRLRYCRKTPPNDSIQAAQAQILKSHTTAIQNTRSSCFIIGQNMGKCSRQQLMRGASADPMIKRCLVIRRQKIGISCQRSLHICKMAKSVGPQVRRASLALKALVRLAAFDDPR